MAEDVKEKPDFDDCAGDAAESCRHIRHKGEDDLLCKNQCSVWTPYELAKCADDRCAAICNITQGSNKRCRNAGLFLPSDIDVLKTVANDNMVAVLLVKLYGIRLSNKWTRLSFCGVHWKVVKRAFWQKNAKLGVDAVNAFLQSHPAAQLDELVCRPERAVNRAAEANMKDRVFMQAMGPRPVTAEQQLWYRGARILFNGLWSGCRFLSRAALNYAWQEQSQKEKKQTAVSTKPGRSPGATRLKMRRTKRQKYKGQSEAPNASSPTAEAEAEDKDKDEADEPETQEDEDEDEEEQEEKESDERPRAAPLKRARSPAD
jgi:hypothetical protein